MKLLNCLTLIAFVFLATHVNSQSSEVPSDKEANQTGNSLRLESIEALLGSDLLSQKTSKKQQPTATLSSIQTSLQILFNVMGHNNERFDSTTKKIDALEKKMEAALEKTDDLEKRMIALEEKMKKTIDNQQLPLVIEIVGNPGDNNLAAYAVSPAQALTPVNLPVRLNNNAQNTFFAHNYHHRN